jgi:hypothetical protein
MVRLIPLIHCLLIQSLTIPVFRERPPVFLSTARSVALIPSLDLEDLGVRDDKDTHRFISLASTYNTLIGNPVVLLIGREAASRTLPRQNLLV